MSKLTFDTKLDPHENAKYFDDVGAPALFERMASELLKFRPRKTEVTDTLINMLTQERSGGSADADAAPEAAASASAGEAVPEALLQQGRQIFTDLCTVEGEDLAVTTVCSLLGVDDCGLEALCPGLKQEGHTVSPAEWDAWLRSFGSGAELTLNWLESRVEATKGGGWCPEFEDRVAQVFKKVDGLLKWDGEIDKAELLSLLKQTPLAAKVLFSELDTNSDGGVSVTEWCKWFKDICVRQGNGAALDRLEWIEESLNKAIAERSDAKAKTLQERGETLNNQLEEIAQALQR